MEHSVQNETVCFNYMWGGLSHNPLKITFMAFAMIGANIITAVATTNDSTRKEENINSVKRYEDSYFSINSSICGSIGCSFTPYKYLNCTSFNQGRIISNPGSHLFPIWWDAFISGWSNNTKSCFQERKWQV